MTKSVSRVEYARIFTKQLKRAPLAIKIAFRKRRELFIQDPFYPQLNNHALTGKYSGYRSINVTGDWRAIFSEFEDEFGKVVIFEIIGTHSQLYK